jgi:hypothetical protein
VIAPRPNPSLLIAVLLACLMALTRYHHFGSSAFLPDASFAVFLLAGFYLRSPWWLALFMAEAALIDSVTIAGGVSAFCVTPAYALLIPTYGVLWLAGRVYSRLHRWAWTTLVPLAAVALVGVAVAFLISSGSFYLFSGYFPEMSALEYAGRVARYFPPYLTSACLYLALAAMIHVAVRTGLIPRRQSTDIEGTGPH